MSYSAVYELWHSYRQRLHHVTDAWTAEGAIGFESAGKQRGLGFVFRLEASEKSLFPATPLYVHSHLFASRRASSIVGNSFISRYSCRTVQLKCSTYAFCHSLPGAGYTLGDGGAQTQYLPPQDEPLHPIPCASDSPEQNAKHQAWHTPGAPAIHDAGAQSPHNAASVQRLEVSLICVLENTLIQCQIRNQALQARILHFQTLQLLRLVTPVQPYSQRHLQYVAFDMPSSRHTSPIFLPCPGRTSARRSLWGNLLQLVSCFFMSFLHLFFD